MSGGLTAARRILSAALAVGVVFAAPAVASATTRFAAPGGTATAAECTTPANPCTIFEAAQGTGVIGADEVVVAPGNYSDSAGDLGPSGLVQPAAGNVHGDPARARPVITLDTPGNLSGAFFISGTTVADLEIDTAVNRANYVVFSGGLVDDVIARSSSSVSQTIACAQDGGTIRNSVCLTSGSGAAAIGASLGGGVGTMNLTVRNVTAVSTGTGSFGASYRFFGGSSANWIVNARSLIAKGTSKDVVAGALLFSGTCPNTTVSLDFSDYATTQTQSDACGGVAAASPAGSGNNQTADPMLAADGFHQMAGSITIDHGFADGSSSTTDIDGQARTIGSAPDIGADELGHQTTTSVSCTPSVVEVGSSTTCTGTVSDTAATAASTPSGDLEFSSDISGGTLSSGGTCALVMLSSSSASCAVTYTPTQFGSGVAHVTASYGGDAAHDSSEDVASVDLEQSLTSPPPPTFTGGPPGVNPCPALRKKLKKAKKARNTAMIRKLKKKLRNRCGIR
jgi:hypothetical protein